MVMYGIYNSDTFEQLFDTMHKMHNKTTWNENYLLVNSIFGIIDIYPRMELATVHKFSFVFNNYKRKICQNV